jgi:hypothetical protein
MATYVATKTQPRRGGQLQQCKHSTSSPSTPLYLIERCATAQTTITPILTDYFLSTRKSQTVQGLRALPAHGCCAAGSTRQAC